MLILLPRQNSLCLQTSQKWFFHYNENAINSFVVDVFPHMPTVAVQRLDFEIQNPTHLSLC